MGTVGLKSSPRWEAPQRVLPPGQRNSHRGATRRNTDVNIRPWLRGEARTPMSSRFEADWPSKPLLRWDRFEGGWLLARRWACRDVIIWTLCRYRPFRHAGPGCDAHYARMVTSMVLWPFSGQWAPSVTAASS
jgi:hypothetical protein